VHSQEEIYLLALNGLVNVNHVAQLDKMLREKKKGGDEPTKSGPFNL